jgi:hypothetical protein
MGNPKWHLANRIQDLDNQLLSLQLYLRRHLD